MNKTTFSAKPLEFYLVTSQVKNVVAEKCPCVVGDQCRQLLFVEVGLHFLHGQGGPISQGTIQDNLLSLVHDARVVRHFIIVQVQGNSLETHGTRTANPEADPPVEGDYFWIS